MFEKLPQSSENIIGYIVKVSKHFMKSEIKYFDIHEIDQAWEWLKS